MSHKELIIAWQDQETRQWVPVGRLGKGGNYYFAYTEGAKVSKNFEPFGWMRPITSGFLSKEIFPLFANRLLPKSRPDYRDYISWLALDPDSVDDLEVLSRSGGVRATDKLEIFPCPAPDERGRYSDFFFVHGLRYLLPENVTRLNSLTVGERLYVMRDIQNVVDPEALLLRTRDPVSMVGYCPRYLAAEFRRVIDFVTPNQFVVTVRQVNHDAPYDLRVLCQVESPWPKEYAPCSEGMYRPLSDLTTLQKMAGLHNAAMPIKTSSQEA